MVKFPERKWIPLSEAVARIARCCGCSVEEARGLCLDGLKDRILYCRGTRHVFAELTRLESIPYKTLSSLPIDWAANTVGRRGTVYECVEIERSRLDEWLSDARDNDADSPAVTVAEPGSAPKINGKRHVGAHGKPRRDAEAALVALFPEGVPAGTKRDDIGARVNGWLTENDKPPVSLRTIDRALGKL